MNPICPLCHFETEREAPTTYECHRSAYPFPFTTGEYQVGFNRDKSIKYQHFYTSPNLYIDVNHKFNYTRIYTVNQEHQFELILDHPDSTILDWSGDIQKKLQLYLTFS